MPKPATTTSACSPLRGPDIDAAAHYVPTLYVSDNHVVVFVGLDLDIEAILLTFILILLCRPFQPRREHQAHQPRTDGRPHDERHYSHAAP